MAVFDYFFSVGAGVATGAVCVVIPAMWLYRRFLGGQRDE